MIYSPKSSLIKRTGHYTAQQLYAAFEPMIPADQKERARRLIDRIVVLCKAFDLDEVAVCAIVWIETGAAGSGLPFRSEWWRKGLNAGNLGITGDPAQNAAAQTWQTPEDAANGLMAHVVAYVYGKDWRTVWNVDELGKPQTWDKRFDHVLTVFGGAHLDTLEALNNRWAIDVDRAYDRKLAERANKLTSLMDDPPVETPSTPEEPVFATWRQQFDVMFGKGWKITQDWAARGGPDLYDYGKGHGLDGSQHTGVDVGIPYGTRLFAPSAATVVCGGTGVGSGAQGQGCDAFNDWGDGDSVKQGIGRIELLFPDGRSLIYGHARTATVKPGDRVTRGQQIGTSGGMYGAHIHLEARRFSGGTYQLIDPKALLESLPIGATQPEPETPPMASPLKITRQMIPNGNGNRPGSKLNQAPLWITIHETANTSRGAGAKMHADFVRNGGGSEGVSFHATVDDKEAYQMLPADEVGYHAGDGCNSRADDLGCFQSFAIETCVNSDSNWATTKNNLVELVAAIITGDPRIDFAGRKGQFSVDRIAQHNKWSGKHCPAKIRNEGSWNALLAQIRARVAELEGGTTPAPDPEPEPTEPEIVPGVDWGIAKRAFDNPDPALADYKLTKGGPLSTAYLERAKATGHWPQLTDRWPYENGARVYYRFSNGDLALFLESDKSIRWIEGVIE